MKKLLLAAFSLSSLTSISVQAQNLVVNGDFESGSGNTFTLTPPWYNRGFNLNQGANARSNALSFAGSFSAIISDRFDVSTSTFAGVSHNQKTSHLIAAGESFALSYVWRPSDTSWQTGRDNVRFVLFATDNNALGGSVVWSSTLTSGNFVGSDLTIWRSISQTTDVVTSAAVGKNLFVNFYGVDLNGLSATAGFARVDNISVTAIPEPGSFAGLLGVASLGAVGLRRRRRSA